MRNLLVFLVVLATTACDNIWDCRKGEGPVVTQTLGLDEFNSIKLSGSGKVYISQGEVQEVQVEGQQNMIDNLNLRIRDGHWDIRFLDCTRSHKELIFYITVPEINALEISGSGDIIGENMLITDNMDIEISGSGKVSADVTANSLSMRIDGSGDIWLAGESEFADLRISGSGNLNAYDLEVDTYDIRITGSGGAKVTALEALDVNITGSGSVSYQGTPTINSSITGSGKVVSRN